jgi:hypothetical protein
LTDGTPGAVTALAKKRYNNPRERKDGNALTPMARGCGGWLVKSEDGGIVSAIMSDMSVIAPPEKT